MRAPARGDAQGVAGAHAPSPRRRALLASGLAALAGASGLAGCKESAPIRVGFLGGLTGADASSVEDGRNGAMLAIEQCNQDGGVNGHRLELIIQDDGHGPKTGQRAVAELIAAQPVAIIGPFLSSVGIAVLPQIDAARILTLSPTATASELAGKDDYLFRLNSSERDAARAYAAMLYQRGQRRVAMAMGIDDANRAYAMPWRDGFSAAFEALGGRVVAQAGFALASSTSFEDVVRVMLASGPDGLVFVGSSVDVARLAHQTSRMAPAMPMAASDSAAGSALLELGGRAVEGMLVGELFDRADQSPRYLRFREAYAARFLDTPGYHAVATYDAVTVLKAALLRRAGGESLKQAVLKHGPYQGLQQSIAFDPYGDIQRPIHFAVIRNGQFEPIP